jgi:hypothetical protein
MQNWAVIVAIQDYPSIFTGLAKKLADANAAAMQFRDWVIAVKSVPPANIIACAGEGCGWRTTGTSRKDIVNAFTQFVTTARVNGNVDELYVFFSGHGIAFSVDPYEPPIDVLIGSDFTEPSTSGSACLRFQEIKESLRVAVGPGKHFYFIDACRNPMSASSIRPAVLDVVWGNLKRGNATTYVFFSTAPGDVAKVNSGFGTALLGGLKGSGRAKTWVGGRMYVTFESLRSHLQRTLGKNDLDPEKRGPADGNIVELVPIPTSNCDVEVIDGGAKDQFTLKVADVRRVERAPIMFEGPRKSVPLEPEDYLLNLTTATGNVVVQIDPPVDMAGVDLYEDRRVRFQKQLPVPPAPPMPLTPSDARVRIFGALGLELSLRQIASGDTTTMTMGADELLTGLEPGLYKAHVKDGNFKLASRRFKLSPGATLNLDFTPEVSRGAHLSLSKAVPIRGPLVDFSETLNSVPDWNLSLWLAVIGGSRILAAPDTFSKLKSLQLETFTDARPGKSVLYVLAGELQGEAVPACAPGTRPEWRLMRAVPAVDGLFEMKLEFEPGPLLVTYAKNEKETKTILVYGLPNRATLLTFADHERAGRQIQQFILPIHSLNNYISRPELEYLEVNNRRLRLVRYMSTAQRLFSLQSPIEGHTYQGTDQYWFDLLHHKWLDPVMALIACYEVIRRGSAEQQKPLMQEVLANMRKYFPGFGDTEVIAMLLNEPFSPPRNPPLLLDGLIAIGEKDTLPLPADKLVFDSIWTMWKNALFLTKSAAMARGG